MVMTSDMYHIMFGGISARECDIINSKGKILHRGRRRINNAPIIRFSHIKIRGGKIA